MENKTGVLPILNYHAIETTPGNDPLDFRQRDYALSLDAFREQLDYLPREGYRSLSSKEMALWFEAQDEKAALCMVLTFDDGLISHYEWVLPELSARNLKGIFFVTPTLIGTKGHMTWDHLKELLKKGHEIGSHGLTHRSLTYISARTLWQELAGSKKMIEDNLGMIADCFSVPRAYYNPRVLRAAEEVGYRLLFTSFADVNGRDGQRPLSLNRIAMKPEMDIRLFQRLIQGQCGDVHRRETIKAFLRGTVPPVIYDLAATLKQAVSTRGRV